MNWKKEQAIKSFLLDKENIIFLVGTGTHINKKTGKIPQLNDCSTLEEKAIVCRDNIDKILKYYYLVEK